MSSLGDNIKRYRLMRKMTQDDLANKLNTTKSAISRYELGKREPSLAQIEMIAFALGISSQDLIGVEAFETGEEFFARWNSIVKSADPANQVSISYHADGSRRLTDHRKEKLNHNYDQLDDEGQQQLYKYSEFLVKNTD